MSKLIIGFLIPMSVLAQECVMQQKISTQTKTVISEVTDIRKDIIPWGKGDKKCLVKFKALIEGQWHSAYGEYIWDGELPASDACGAAVTKAKKDLTQSVKPANIVSEDVLICNDDKTQNKLKEAKVGSIIDIGQVRPHPNFTSRFYHNGTECRWFLDSSWTGKDIRQYQGVACKLEPSKWVVVDKF
jgi:hypothetical protein